MRVIAAGGGVGGLAFALAASRAGHSVVILEQAPVFLEVGAGLQLSPNAMKALWSLGVGPELEKVATQAQFVEVRDQASGSVLLETALGQEAERRWGAPYLHIHRADLHSALLAATVSRRNIELRNNARVIAAASSATGAEVELENGDRLAADVAVGCDGVRSVLRTAVQGPVRAQFTGQVAWRGLTPAEAVEPELRRAGARVWTGSGRHFVHYPVRNGTLINFIAVTEERVWRTESWSEAGSLDELQRAFAAWPASVRRLIDAAPGVMRWALYDRPPLRQWSKGRTTLLGDAAHPMLPFLAQGAAMAIEDAVVLSACLTKEADDGGDPCRALQRYQSLRLSRTAKVQAWSRRNARLFHLPSPLAQGVFGMARMGDRVRRLQGPERFDWLYGYDPVSAA